MSRELTAMEEMDIDANKAILNQIERGWYTLIPHYRANRILNSVAQSGPLVTMYRADFNAIIKAYEDRINERV